MLAKTGPVLVIVATTVASVALGFEARGVALVGDVPQRLPAFSLPPLTLALWRELAVSALLISVIGFVESVSVGKTLAAKRRQRIDANQELLALGAANVASAVSGGFPVTGGFSRSVVNFDAGAQTQLASVLHRGWHRPRRTGAHAGAVLPAKGHPRGDDHRRRHLADRRQAADARLALFPRRLHRRGGYHLRAPCWLGVELGVLSGITCPIALHLHKTSRPHIAMVGQVPGTEHFRNVERHR
jgi:SulP family sulfate permease